MSEELPSGNSPHESECESESDGNATKESAQNAADKGGDSHTGRFKGESAVALCLGFVFFGLLFAFLGWLEGIFEKGHVNFVVIFCLVLTLFVLGIAGLAWLLIEWFRKARVIITLAVVATAFFILFLCDHKSIYLEESEYPSPGPPSQTNQAAEIEEAVKKALPTNITAIMVSETNIFNQTNVVNETNEWRGKEWKPPLLLAGSDRISVTWGESDVSNPIGWGGLNLMKGWTYNTNWQKVMETLVMAYVRNNRFYVDATIPGDLPYGPFKLSGNTIIGHLPPPWQMNYDNDAIEIVNGREIPVFQVIYERPEAVKIYGIMGNQFQVEVQTPKSSLQTFSPENWYDGSFDPASMGLRRIFKYPLWEYPGQRLPNDDVPPDYIEGTEVTAKQLDDYFPYGYAVIYLNEQGEKRIHEIHNKLLEWKWDWDEIKIEPDFTNHVVNWTLPANFEVAGPNLDLSFHGSTVKGTTRFEKEIVRAKVGYFPNKPCAYAGILSTNQQEPVFVIGFRIPQSQNEVFYP